ncbi:Fucose permease [Chitinophaga costaii]|uniref:Fucose permease n=1 Tax=Chitinophaga costaii TaxID=1335309 RepID=A0A1C4FRW5_9BACT|nr:MFS transporter [Chitinophaga costaii]SCC58710.1 Fucose permease [Chitinophaga costaii]
MIGSSSWTPARAARIAVSALFFLQGLCFASWTSRIPALQQSLGLNDAGLGSVLFALPIGLMVSIPIAGWLVAQYGSKVCVISGAAAYACILTLLGLTQTPWQLVLGLIFFGFASNITNIAMNTQAVAVEARYGRPVMASFHGYWSLAGFAGAAIGWGMTNLQWAPYRHFACITVMDILTLLLVSRYVLQQDINTDRSRPRFAWPGQVLLMLGLVAFCAAICEGTMDDWSGVYFKKVVIVPPSLVGVGYVAFKGTSAGARLIADVFTAKFGRKHILQACGVLTAGGFMLAICLPYLVTATIGFLLVGAGVSIIVPLVNSAAGRATHLSTGLALATVSTIGNAGFLIGPPLIGFVAQWHGLQVSFFIIALLGGCITVLASRVKT